MEQTLTLILTWVVLVLGVSWLVVAALKMFRRDWSGKASGKAGAAAGSASDAAGKHSARVAYPVTLAHFWSTLAIVAFALGGLSHLANALLSTGVQLWNVPIGDYWPQLPPGFEADTAPDTSGHLVQGGLTQADLIVENVPWGARLMLAGGELLIAVACLAVVILIRKACSGILKGDPFTHSLRLWAWWSALVVLVAGFAGQVLKFWGQGAVANAALPWWSVDPDADPALKKALEAATEPGPEGYMDTLPQGPHFGGAEFPLTPLWAAMLIIVVVELLNAGVRLATEKARLARDVEGLV